MNLLNEMEKDSAPHEPTNTDLEELSGVINFWKQNEELLNTCELTLKEYKKEKIKLEEDLLPSLCASLGGLEKIRVNGINLSIDSHVYSSITKENKNQAYAFLREIGSDSIIKNNITITFSRGEDEDATNVLDNLQKYFPDLVISRKETIHPQTLKSFIKECAISNIRLDDNLFGIYRVQKATLKLAE